LLGATLAGGISVLYLSLCMQGVSLASARSVTLVALLLGQLVLVFCVRTSSQPFWRSETGWNPRILPVLTGILILLGLAVWIPIFKHAVHIAGLSAMQFTLAFAVALATTLWLEPFKRVGIPRLSHRRSRSLSNFGTG
jgi:magnesium-transporting ATPase (P-type)